MTDREFQLLRFYMGVRGKAAVMLATLLAVIVGVLVFALREEGTNETLTMALGIGIGAIGTGLGVITNAVSRDITEYLKDSRQMPERADV